MPLLNSAFSRKATFFMCFGPLRPLPGFFSTPGGIDTSKGYHKVKVCIIFSSFSVEISLDINSVDAIAS